MRTQNDIVQEDGSVLRTITTTIIIPAKAYKAQQDLLIKQITDLTATKAANQSTLSAVEEKLSIKQVTPQ